MKLDRVHIAAAYTLAAFMVFTPLSEALVAAYPPRFADAGWRLAASTVFSRALLTPLLGLFLATALAHFREHRSLLLVIAVVCGLGTIALVGSAALVLLDAIELRARIQPQHQGAFNVANAQVLLKIGFAALMSLLLALAAHRSARRVVRRPAPSPLIHRARHSVLPADASAPPPL